MIYSGGRLYMSPLQERRLDALSYRQGSRLTDPNRVIGAKPAAFCYWMFDLLGALPGDEVVDLFAGSGGVARAWSVIEGQAVASSSSDASRGDGGADASRPPATTTDMSLEYSATRRASPAWDHYLATGDPYFVPDTETATRSS